MKKLAELIDGMNYRLANHKPGMNSEFILTLEQVRWVVRIFQSYLERGEK